MVIFVGLLFVVVGIIMLVKQMKRSKNNTESVTAEVVEYITEYTTSGENNIETPVYYPVFRYCVSGKWYESKHDVGTGKKKYNLGEPVELMYNPDKPEDVIVAGEKTTLIISIVSIILGVGVIILAFNAK